MSTAEQTLHLQEDALKQVGCNRILTDTASGAQAERAGLARALGHLRESDPLVVWRLDRSGRSLRHLIGTVTDFDQRGGGFRGKTVSH